MAGDENAVVGDVLMWRVEGDLQDDAEARARRMGSMAETHRLGDWGIFPIGLGRCWWFDLALAKDVDAAFLLLTFNRLPDHRY